MKHAGDILATFTEPEVANLLMMETARRVGLQPGHRVDVGITIENGRLVEVVVRDDEKW